MREIAFEHIETYIDGFGFGVSIRHESEPGIGIDEPPNQAPLFYLARVLSQAGARPLVFYGGRGLADIPLRERIEQAGFECLCSTDDGSFGFAGFVTALVGRELDRAKPAVVYACGPDPMMKTLAALTAKHGLPAEFSLESVIGCGIGACCGCVHRIRNEGGNGWVKICEEGPVFPGERILWP